MKRLPRMRDVLVLFLSVAALQSALAQTSATAGQNTAAFQAMVLAEQPDSPLPPSAPSPGAPDDVALSVAPVGQSAPVPASTHRKKHNGLAIFGMVAALTILIVVMSIEMKHS